MKVFDIIFTGLIPLVLLVAGWMMQFHPPKKQNAWIGYRTTRSMKNAETWRFANTYCGKYWCISGGILLLVAVGCSVGYFFMSMQVQTIFVFGNIVLQMAILICTLFQTERAIRTQFDETGKRKDTTHD